MMSLQVFQDQENVGVQTRNGAKKVDTQGHKRTVLGQITNVRQQPARAVKVKIVHSVVVMAAIKRYHIGLFHSAIQPIQSIRRHRK